MKTKNNRILLSIVILSIIAFCFILWYTKTEYRFNRVNYTEITSQNAVWDLSDVDFETTVIKLVGDVEHIPNEILTPEQFSDSDKIEIGSPTDVNQGRTARLTLIMPNEKSYRLHTIGDYARKIFLNGEERGSQGVPSTSAKTFEAGYGAIEVDVFATDKKIELVVQGGNFVHVNTNGYTNVLVGNSELLDWFIDSENGVEYAIVGIMFLLFIFHLILAIMFGNFSINFTFSLTCLVWGLRLGLVGSKILYDIFPNIPWILAFKIEYITIPIGSILILRVFYLLLIEAYNRWILYGFQAILAVFSIIFMVVDTYTMSSMLIPLQATFILSLVYLLIAASVWFLKNIRRKIAISVTKMLSFIPLLIIFYAGISDALYFNEIFLFGVNSTLAEIATLNFAIFEAIAVFYITVQTIEAVKNAEKEALDNVKALENLNRIKTEFLQNMSHEMRTPLTVIGTGIDYASIQINDQNFDKTEILDTVSIIKKETERLGRMVSGMVSMAEISPIANREKVNFSQLTLSCVETFSLIAEKNKLKLLAQIEDNIPYAFIDNDSFIRVYQNILKNAVEHTLSGSIIVKSWQKNGYIYVSIADTGSGVSPTILNKITQRGVSGKGGTGIGLYICKTVIEAHGGTLTISSTENQGTSVIFTVPVYAGQMEGYRSEKENSFS